MVALAGLHLSMLICSSPIQGDEVTDMYFVASAYAGDHLSEVRQPYILIRDADQDMTLCEYHAAVSRFAS